MRSSLRFRTLAVLSALVGVAGSACGGSTVAGLDPPGCTPGEQVACTCSDGSDGAQACQQDGTGYEACNCSGAGGSGGSTGGSGGSTGGSGGNTGGSGGSTGGSGGSTGGSGGGTGGTGGGTGATGGSGGSANCQNPPPDQDIDGDGYTTQQGDCNECDAMANPGAFDFASNAMDEDCSGVPDDAVTACDDALPEAAATEEEDARNAAKAIGLCRAAGQPGTPATWGVLGSAYVFADGSTASGTPDGVFVTCTGVGGTGSPPNALSHGVLPAFGSAFAPIAGGRLLALSTGVARPGVVGDSPGGASMCTQSATPAGFPASFQARCPGTTTSPTPIARDTIALELRLRAPTNARSMSFAVNFLTYEFNAYVCTEFADTFAALSFSSHSAIPSNHNLTFDPLAIPLSANTELLGVCTAGVFGGATFSCELGPSALTGTGFEDHAASGWLRTTAPVQPGEEFVLRFAIWDSGDSILDSTVLLDDFTWYPDDRPVQTVRIANP